MANGTSMNTKRNNLPIVVSTSAGLVIARLDGSFVGAEVMISNRGYKEVKALRVATDIDEKTIPEVW